ncbi:thiazolylpeptide-type bacteriocin [Streptomyces sp. M2CJ-2]|nr:thiazolylpeptide-type bacteriocin [Streptomyces sp. M2CJ-2]
MPNGERRPLECSRTHPAEAAGHGGLRPDPSGDVVDGNLSTLADAILELEAESFEISDYSDASEVMLAGCTSTSSTSTCSATTSTTSCTA